MTERLPGRGVELTWLGNAGFLIDAGTRILVDPFMSEHPLLVYPPPLLDELGPGIDWLLATHDHLDHLDTGFAPKLAGRYPNLQAVLPSPIQNMVSDLLPEEQIHGLQPGDVLSLTSAVSLKAIPAYHGTEVADAYNDGSHVDGRVRFLGYILRTPDIAIYHAGDTIVTEGLLAALDGERIDVAILPVNGRDFVRERRGVVGNMNVREAVWFAREISATVVVPMHWDAMAGNTERPGAVLDAALENGFDFHVLTLARMRSFRLV